MPITIDNRIKKKNGVSRYRVRINYTDTNGKQNQIERLVWEKQMRRLSSVNWKWSSRTKSRSNQAKLPLKNCF